MKQLIYSLRGVIPGLASGKLRQILFGVPHYFWEVAQVRTWHGFYSWCYYKFPYSFNLIKFPPVITLGVTTRCNLSCPHCFRTIMPWGPHDMELPLFEQILDELAMHPMCILKLGGLGEPAVHPQIRDFIFRLVEKKVKTIIYTNGTLLERFSTHEIVEMGFKKLVISIDGIDAQSYESKRVGGNYGMLRANVTRLHQTREELNSHLPQIEIRHVVFPNESRKGLRQFKRDWLEFSDTVMFNNLALLSPQLRGNSAPMFNRCRAIRRELFIGSGGQIAICGDQLWRGTTEDIIGDLHQETILKLWEHPKFQYIRRCHQESVLDNVPFCKNCKEITG